MTVWSTFWHVRPFTCPSTEQVPSLTFPWSAASYSPSRKLTARLVSVSLTLANRRCWGTWLVSRARSSWEFWAAFLSCTRRCPIIMTAFGQDGGSLSRIQSAIGERSPDSSRGCSRWTYLWAVFLLGGPFTSIRHLASWALECHIYSAASGTRRAIGEPRLAGML